METLTKERSLTRLVDRFKSSIDSEQNSEDGVSLLDPNNPSNNNAGGYSIPQIGGLLKAALEDFVSGETSLTSTRQVGKLLSDSLRVAYYELAEKRLENYTNREKREYF